MSKFKVGDRVSWIEFASSYHSDGDYRFRSATTKYKGTILDLDTFAALLQYDRVEFGKRVQPLSTLTRLVPKKPRTKAPTREPQRIFVNRDRNADGSSYLLGVHYNTYDEAKSMAGVCLSYIETVEFVEVLK